MEGDHAVEEQVGLALGQHLQAVVVHLRRRQVAQVLVDEVPCAGFGARRA